MSMMNAAELNRLAERYPQVLERSFWQRYRMPISIGVLTIYFLFTLCSGGSSGSRSTSNPEGEFLLQLHGIADASGAGSGQRNAVGSTSDNGDIGRRGHRSSGGAV